MVRFLETSSYEEEWNKPEIFNLKKSTRKAGSYLAEKEANFFCQYSIWQNKT